MTFIEGLKFGKYPLIRQYKINPLVSSLLTLLKLLFSSIFIKDTKTYQIFRDE